MNEAVAPPLPILMAALAALIVSPSRSLPKALVAGLIAYSITALIA